jgi:cell wall integrity and stress response component
MASQRAARFWATLGVTALLCGVVAAQSIPVAYCASVNTANMPAINSDYQSQGRCHDNCTTMDLPFAIVQDHNCWCSGLIPNKADQKSKSSCNKPCPGYPSDWCGGSGLYLYMQLGNPLGTAGAGATNTMSSSSINDDGASAKPTPTVQTVTVGGVIKTVTATPSTTGGSTAELEASGSSNGLSTGATVGIAVGVVGIVAVAAIFFFMWYMRRRRREGADNIFTVSSRRNSSPGMLSTPKTGEVSENRFAEGPTAAGPVWEVGQNSKRRSHLMPVDPRLDPFAKGIYARDQNKSHDSIGSLQDNQDYSRRIQEPPRVLRAMNPDPDHD